MFIEAPFDSPNMWMQIFGLQFDEYGSYQYNVDSCSSPNTKHSCPIELAIIPLREA